MIVTTLTPFDVMDADAGLPAAAGDDRIEFSALRILVREVPMLDISRDIQSLDRFQKEYIRIC